MKIPGARVRKAAFLKTWLSAAMALVFAFGVAGTCHAIETIMPPNPNPMDGNGIDLASGMFCPADERQVAVGTQQSGLFYAYTHNCGQGYSDQLSGYLHFYVALNRGATDQNWQTLRIGAFIIDASFKGATHTFVVGGATTNLNGGSVGYGLFTGAVREINGNSLISCTGVTNVLNRPPNSISSWNPGGVCTMTLNDGTSVVYQTQGTACRDNLASSYFQFDCGFTSMQSAVLPDGVVLAPTYYPFNVRYSYGGDYYNDIKPLSSVSSSAGWQVKLLYVDNGGTFGYQVNQVTAVNSSQIYCDPNAVDACPGGVSAGYPSLTTIPVTSGGPYPSGTPSGVKDAIPSYQFVRNGTLQQRFSQCANMAASIVPYCADTATPMSTAGQEFLWAEEPDGVVRWASFSSGTNVTYGFSAAGISPYDYLFDSSLFYDPSNYLPQTSLTVFHKAGRQWAYVATHSTPNCPTVNNSPYVVSCAPFPGENQIKYSSVTMRILNPDGSVKTAKTGGTKPKLASVTDELGRITRYSYLTDSQQLFPTNLLSVTDNEGIVTAFTYDARGNVLTKTITNKDGVTKLTQRATYPVSITSSDPLWSQLQSYADPNCNNPKTCNKPLSFTDAAGNTTFYTYDPAHGGILTQTGPAVTDPVNNQQVRPQTRYSYSQLTPYVKNSSGALVASPPVWRLTKTSSCRTATAADPAWCTLTANRSYESVTEFEYNSNNLLLTKQTVRSGDANVALAYAATNLWQSTSYTYDNIGNVVAVDGPRTDIDDKTYTTYDVWRRPVYEIGADPDGAGALKRAVVKHHYDVDGREDLTQTGTGSSITFVKAAPSDPVATIPTDVTDFVPTTFTRNTFNATTGLLTKTEVGQP